MTPARGIVLLRHIDTPETLPGGRIILTTQTRDTLTACQMEVVAIGAPTICEDEECGRRHRVLGSTLWDRDPHHYCDAEVGDWILVRHRCLTDTHLEDLFCCHQDDVQAILIP